MQISATLDFLRWLPSLRSSPAYKAIRLTARIFHLFPSSFYFSNFATLSVQCFEFRRSNFQQLHDAIFFFFPFTFFIKKLFFYSLTFCQFWIRTISILWYDFLFSFWKFARIRISHEHTRCVAIWLVKNIAKHPDCGKNSISSLFYLSQVERAKRKRE